MTDLTDFTKEDIERLASTTEPDYRAVAAKLQEQLEAITKQVRKLAICEEEDADKEMDALCGQALKSIQLSAMIKRGDFEAVMGHSPRSDK